MSRWKPVKQPVFGSSGKQSVRCGQWFAWGNYYRKGGGYRSVCSKCLAKAQVPRRQATGDVRSGYGAPRRRR
jgi:hypothetical protein